MSEYDSYLRIASLSPAVTEIIFELKRETSLCVVDHYSDTPVEAQKLPRLKGHQDIDPETLREHRPDMVFTTTVIQASLSEKLKASGFAAVHYDPRSVLEIHAMIRSIGTLLDASARAEALIQSMQQKLSAVKKKAALLPRRPRFYIEEWHNPPMVSGNWVPELVRLAGGVPMDLKVASQSTTQNPLSREVTLAEVQSFDPEIIVLSICGAGSSASKDLLLSRKGWSELPCVKRGHLFVIDDSLLNRPGPRITAGAERLFSWAFQVVH